MAPGNSKKRRVGVKTAKKKKGGASENTSRIANQKPRPKQVARKAVRIAPSTMTLTASVPSVPKDPSNENTVPLTTLFAKRVPRMVWRSDIVSAAALGITSGTSSGKGKKGTSKGASAGKGNGTQDKSSVLLVTKLNSTPLSARGQVQAAFTYVF